MIGYLLVDLEPDETTGMAVAIDVPHCMDKGGDDG